MGLDFCLSSEEMVRGAIAGGVDYLQDNKEIKSLVVGVSGGVDSAVTTAIASECCSEMRHRGRPVYLIGAHLSIGGNATNEAEHLKDILLARNVMKKYCDRYTFIDLDEIYNKVIEVDDIISVKHKELLSVDEERQLDDDDLELSPSEKIRAGNIKARLRMIYLYNLANASKGLVLSTDNLTEYNLGFWTLHGDVGDFGLIQNLWKTEVFRVANFIGGSVKECTNKPPTDGLGITDTSLDQILPGWEKKFKSHIEAYEYVDTILIEYLGKEQSVDKDHPVIKRHLNSKFKRMNPYNVSREILTWTHNLLN